MSVVTISQVSMTEAEGLLVALWRALELYQIPSPRFRVEEFAGSLNLRITFQSDKDAKVAQHMFSAGGGQAQ
jgi:hypothetical protein